MGGSSFSKPSCSYAQQPVGASQHSDMMAILVNIQSTLDSLVQNMKSGTSEVTPIAIKTENASKFTVSKLIQCVARCDVKLTFILRLMV